MHLDRNADPRHALFCLALIASAPSPRDAVHAFGQRLLSRHTSALV